MPTSEKEIVTTTLRVRRELSNAVQQIAMREGETAATIWRRILRAGLAQEEQRAWLEKRRCESHRVRTTSRR